MDNYKQHKSVVDRNGLRISTSSTL